MPIMDTGTFLKKNRLNKGFSQDKLCEGICSVQSLSDIENGRQGVSPVTFQKLTERLGIVTKVYPYFSSIDDYECFMAFRRIELYLNSFQLEAAFEDLKSVEKRDFAGNVFYYKKWLMGHAIISFVQGDYEDEVLMHCIEEAISIGNKFEDDPYSNPNGCSELHKFEPLDSLFARCTRDVRVKNDINEPINSIVISSLDDITLYTLIAGIFSRKAMVDEALKIVDLVLEFIDKMKYPDKAIMPYKQRLNLIKYDCLLKEKSYIEMNNEIESVLGDIAWTRQPYIVIQETWYYGLSSFYCNKTSKAIELFRQVIGCLYFVNAGMITRYISYIKEELKINDEVLNMYNCIDPCKRFEIPPTHDYELFESGVSVLDNKEFLDFGALLKYLRTSRDIPSKEVYEGLCSKSKYSKIENGIQNPSLLLSRALLGRLGIKESLFDFYGNKEESEYEEIQYKLSLLNGAEVQKYKTLLLEIEKLKITKDVQVKQYIMLNQGIFEADNDTKEIILKKAWSLTRESEELEQIPKRCTWNEYYILLHLIRCSIYKDEIKGLYRLLSLIDRIKQDNIDISQKRVTLPILYLSIPQAFINKKMYRELLDIDSDMDMPIMKLFPGIIAINKICMDYARKELQCPLLSETELCAAIYTLKITNNIPSLEYAQIILPKYRESAEKYLLID